jgi:hypothetical protein
MPRREISDRVDPTVLAYPASASPIMLVDRRRSWKKESREREEPAYSAAADVRNWRRASRNSRKSESLELTRGFSENMQAEEG